MTVQPAGVDWNAMRACPTCLQSTGKPCVALNGAVEGGRPDGVRTELRSAHARRQPRRGRRRNEPRV